MLGADCLMCWGGEVVTKLQVKLLTGIDRTEENLRKKNLSSLLNFNGTYEMCQKLLMNTEVSL